MHRLASCHPPDVDRPGPSLSGTQAIAVRERRGFGKAPAIGRTTMILTFTQLVPEPEPDLEDYVRAKLARLETVITIKSAHVTLLQSPCHFPFRATVHLEVPGPDLRADELGHTQMAALDSAFANLKEQSSLCHAG